MDKTRRPVRLRHVAGAMAEALDRATYAGYAAGFAAARDHAAKLAEARGQAALSLEIRSLAPLPERRRSDPGRA